MASVNVSSIGAMANGRVVLFSIDDVRPLHWNDEAIDHLVLHDEYKDILLTLVNNHKIIKSQNHDVIPGKGEDALGQKATVAFC